MLEWAGAPLPPASQACNLLPALRGEAWAPRRLVFAEQAGDVSLTSASLFSMVRDTRYKLVHILGSDEGQLFDLQADPLEQRNLWSAPAFDAQGRRLLGELLDWRMQSSVHTMDVMAHAR